jgi:hypothetical protein
MVVIGLLLAIQMGFNQPKQEQLKMMGQCGFGVMEEVGLEITPPDLIQYQFK